MPLDLDSLDDAEKFQKHFVLPLVDEVKRALEPLVARVETLEKGTSGQDARLKKLEGYATRLGTVYSGIIAVVTFLAHYTWGKVKSKFNI